MRYPPVVDYAVEAANYIPRNAAGSAEPFHKPDHRAKKHSRPTSRRKKVAWVRRERHAPEVA